jgi:hypothetical protein
VGTGPNMRRPCITWCPLERIFIGAIVTGCKDETRTGKISEQPFDGLAFVRPDGLSLHDLFPAKRGQSEIAATSA